MDYPQPDQLLRQLRSREPRQAWATFLDAYSPLVVDVVRLFERDQDAVADCYLFVCEQLSQNNFRRLLRFRPDGPASFSTWLCAIVRNLCLDYHRREFGRHRIFESIARMRPLDQEVFQAFFVECLPAEEAYLKLRPRFAALTFDQFGESAGRVQQALSDRQRWLLAVRRARAAHNPTGSVERDEASLLQVPSEALNPESSAALQEERAALVRGMARLSTRERLLIRLRFERDLTLEEIANLLRLDNAQCADRRIREALEKLRKGMT